ncbi:MAG: pilus assembly protein [Hyphomonas sp.]
MSVIRLKDERGTSAVEFAIIAPVFLFLIVSMLAYGIYFGAAHTVQQAAANAARASVAGLDEKERSELATASVLASASHDTLLKSDHVKIELVSDPDRPDVYLVTVVYDASHLPIWDLGPPIPLPSATIRRSSTIRIGGV